MDHTLQIVASPTDLPFDLTTAKAHLRVTDSADDTLITALITVAVQRVEEWANVRFMTQTWDVLFDEFPECDYIQLPLWPIASVTHLKYYDIDGVLQTLSSADYILSGERRPPQITLAPTVGGWPSIQSNRIDAVQLRVVAGRGIADVAKVPQNMIHAAKLVLGHLYENREDMEALSTKGIPSAAELLMFQYKIWFP